MTLPLILLIISIAARSCAELALHGKLRWSGSSYGFWGSHSSWRKYKPLYDSGFQLTPRPDNWYYRLFNLKYKERWPTSATFTIFATDGTHLCQSVSFLTLAASLSIALPLNFFIVWPIILVTHAGVYKILSR